MVSLRLLFLLLHINVAIQHSYLCVAGLTKMVEQHCIKLYVLHISLGPYHLFPMILLSNCVCKLYSYVCVIFCRLQFGTFVATCKILSRCLCPSIRLTPLLMLDPHRHLDHPKGRSLENCLKQRKRKVRKLQRKTNQAALLWVLVFHQNPRTVSTFTKPSMLMICLKSVKQIC